MTLRPRLISRIALFSALIYVFSYATAYLPNVSFVFFIVFAAGYLWGTAAGVLVGLLGMWLWSTFNPYGPTALPLLAAQMCGAAAGGPIGAWLRRRGRVRGVLPRTIILVTVAAGCTIAYYLPVNLVDAWLYQPFWERFVGGMAWAGISLVSNGLIFPLLFPVLMRLYQREGNAV